MRVKFDLNANFICISFRVAHHITRHYNTHYINARWALAANKINLNRLVDPLR